MTRVKMITAKSDYVCEVCGAEVYDYPLGKKPPVCCRKVMLRKYAPITIIFKGNGWGGDK